jgi:hypothetical protein
MSLLPLPAQATPYTYSFKVIAPMENAVDAAIGQAQMFVDVSDAGAGRVMFTYRNIGSQASSITDIYVDDGSLLELVEIHNTPGSVEFAAYPTPPNLPRGENLIPPFVADLCFSADSDPPAESKGINPLESLAIEYSLINGGTLADVIDELASGVLRIGIHVQGFDSGGSESFILVPEPATLSLIAVGATSLIRRRR